MKNVHFKNVHLICFVKHLVNNYVEISPTCKTCQQIFLTESFLTRVSSSLNIICRVTMLTEKIPYFERKSKPSLCLDVFSLYFLSKGKVLSLTHFSPVLHFILKPVI